MRSLALHFCVLFAATCQGQSFDTSSYHIQIQVSEKADEYFTKDRLWRGADGASSIAMENGKVLWLFSDTFICSDSSASRSKSKIIRNSIAIQNSNDLQKASITFYWDRSGKKPEAFFHTSGEFWFWTGHGAMIKDRLIVFLLKVHKIKTGLGFETAGWYVALISNPADDPSEWKIKYIEGPDAFGTIAGSAAVLKDQEYLYAYGAVEPATHEVYLLRWQLNRAYNGDMSVPEWWIDDKWQTRNKSKPVPKPLFIGQTEYSLHYDTSIKKFIQIQSFGFGEGQLGIRMSDRLQGKWTEPYMFYKPTYSGIKRPFMYSAKAHPEQSGDGIYITYNVNSFDFGELIKNETIYFPKFVLLKIEKN